MTIQSQNHNGVDIAFNVQPSYATVRVYKSPTEYRAAHPAEVRWIEATVWWKFQPEDKMVFRVTNFADLQLILKGLADENRYDLDGIVDDGIHEPFSPPTEWWDKMVPVDKAVDAW